MRPTHYSIFEFSRTKSENRLDFQAQEAKTPKKTIQVNLSKKNDIS